MFCMGCGAEVPARAVVCPVCGRDSGRGSGDGRGAHTQAETIDRAVAAEERGAARAYSAPPATAAPAPALPDPSIGSGDLDQPGFPRDALGRSLIFTVLAMAADLLAPWVNVDGDRIAPSSLGLLPLLGVVWLALAVAPLLRPSLRATPLYAAAPLVVGATSLGLAAAVWIRVTLLASQTAAVSTGDSSFQPLGTSTTADVGLYLFLAGAVVLIVAGYQCFLAAARAQERAELRAEASLRAPAPTPAPARVGSASGATQTTLGRHAPGAGRSVPPVPALDGTATGIGSDSRSLPLPLPLPPAAALAEAPLAPHVTPVGPDGVALPGSAAWNQTPNTPDFQRPSHLQGWRRR